MILTTSDASKIAEWAKQAYEHNLYLPERVHLTLLEPSSVVCMSYWYGVGWAMIRRNQPDSTPSLYFFVSPMCQGLGCGKRLVQSLKCSGTTEAGTPETLSSLRVTEFDTDHA